VQGAPADIYAIDLVTGRYDVAAAAFFPQSVNAVGFNVLDGYVYGFLPGAPRQIVRIAADGTVEELGLPAGIPDANHNTGDVDENGQYWLSTQNATSAAAGWRRIDFAPGSPTYGQVVESGPITGGGIENFGFGPDW